MTSANGQSEAEIRVVPCDKRRKTVQKALYALQHPLHPVHEFRSLGGASLTIGAIRPNRFDAWLDDPFPDSKNDPSHLLFLLQVAHDLRNELRDQFPHECNHFHGIRGL